MKLLYFAWVRDQIGIDSEEIDLPPEINTAEEFMGSHSITDSHISTITDTIMLLQYVEIRGEMARAINVFKMRGSWHDKRIREFVITGEGPQIKDSFSNPSGKLRFPCRRFF